MLGMQIMRDRPSRTMTITHRMKIKDLLESNGMNRCRTSPTPLIPNENLKPGRRSLSGTSYYLRAPD